MIKRKIYLYITPFFPSPRSWRGGYCLDAVKALKRDGRYDVVVMTATPYGGDYEYEGVQVYQIPRLKIGDTEYLEELLEPINNCLFLKKLKSMGVRVADIAVCHVHDYGHYLPYALCLRSRNSQMLALAHHHWTGRYAISFGRFGCLPLVGELQYLHRRKHFEAMDAHVFCSEESRRFFGQNVDFSQIPVSVRPMTAQLKWGRRLRNVRLPDSYVWYNGVDRALFHPDTKEHKGFKIGCVSNFNLGKCQEDLIRAFSLVRNQAPGAELIFIGSGSRQTFCRELSRDLGLADSVRFLPEVSHMELADFYRGWDLFVLPSVNEGFCCVFIEANACGVPVVGCNNLSLKEVLPDGGSSPWLIVPHDVEGLATKILTQYHQRARQEFTVDLDIDVLARKYLDWVVKMRDQRKGLQ